MLMFCILHCIALHCDLYESFWMIFCFVWDSLSLQNHHHYCNSFNCIRLHVLLCIVLLFDDILHLIQLHFALYCFVWGELSIHGNLWLLMQEVLQRGRKKNCNERAREWLWKKRGARGGRVSRCSWRLRSALMGMFCIKGNPPRTIFRCASIS